MFSVFIKKHRVLYKMCCLFWATGTIKNKQEETKNDCYESSLALFDNKTSISARKAIIK